MTDDNGNHAATPGPWVFRKQTFHNTSFAGENAGEAVTHAGSVKIGELEIIDPRLSEADARLIAAAPELLEALENITRVAENMRIILETESLGQHEIPSGYFNRAYQAITLAKEG